MDGRMDVRHTDGQTDRQMDRHTDVQRETIIPRHYCVAGYKKNKDIFLLTCDTLPGPDICPNQISYYLKQYGSYGLHKILVPGEIST